MKLLFNVNIFWIISSFFISLISLISHRGNPLLEDSSYFFAFQLTYLCVVVLSKKLSFFTDEKLKLSFFLFGSLLIYISQPLFENDHYRYLWEGRVLSRGGNPYIHAPHSDKYDNILFDKKSSIGFPDLTTIYPPISLIWFGIGGALSSHYRVGLVILMILNSLLVFVLLKNIEMFIKSKWLVILILPLLQKEYIQSVHIDLFAFMWILPFLLTKRDRFIRDSFFILCCIFSKIIGVFFALPLFFLYSKKYASKIWFWLIGLLVLLAFPLFYIYLKQIDGVKGFVAFSTGWIWNPGFYTIFTRGLSFSAGSARLISLSCFLVYVLILCLFYFRKYLKNNCDFSQRDFWGITYLFFSGLMFFTPVYNSWYVIWYLVPALLLNLRTGVLYAFFSFTCYTKYLNADLVPIGEFFGHLFFVFSLTEYYRESKKDYTKVVTAS